jgi:hypothetical protein
MEISKIKLEMYEHIINGKISDSVLKLLIKDNGMMLAKECELWDYKSTFDGSTDAYLKTLKSIASFYNTYGGYIIYGVTELEKDTTFQPTGISAGAINQQILRSKFDSFFGCRLDVTYEEMGIFANGASIVLGLLHIPKRSGSIHSLSPIKDGGDEGGKNILKKDCVYFRTSDECRQVLNHADFEFIAGDRDFYAILDSSKGNRKSIITHNLPDRNFICPVFIGRREIIQELWSWLSDDLQYAKVLAADGGKGKTSIAYEFCQLLINSGVKTINQVVWLTAKKTQFKAIHNEYLSVPETHYSDLRTLLMQICLRTGSLESELEDLSVQHLQRAAKNNLIVYPSFIVIDDVDSNVIDEQRRIVETARIIANSNSRVLITTRANNIYSTDTCIEVPGLVGEDYSDLVENLCEKLKIQQFNSSNIEKIQVASEGSPLFTESILRLCKLGLSVSNAIADWKGKSGESVREAALRKEVSELSMEAIKVLLTVSYVDSCSRTELHQLTEMETVEIEGALESLGNLFLLQSGRFIESEPRFETSASIANLVLKISEEIFPGAKLFLTRVDQISEGLRLSLQGNISEVGSAISQCNALVNERNYSEARNTISSIIDNPKFKENPDLHLMLAKIEYEDPNADPKKIRKSLSEAFIKGQRKEILFEMWFQAEKRHGTKSSIYDVCEKTIKSVINNDYQWCERYLESSLNQAGAIFSYKRKIEILVNAYSHASKVIGSVKSAQWIRIRDLLINTVDEIWNLSMQEENALVAATGIYNAINNGDIRSLNYERLLKSKTSIDQIISDGDTSKKYIDIQVKLDRLIEASVEKLEHGDDNRKRLADKFRAVMD